MFLRTVAFGFITRLTESLWLCVFGAIEKMAVEGPRPFCKRVFVSSCSRCTINFQGYKTYTVIDAARGVAVNSTKTATANLKTKGKLPCRTTSEMSYFVLFVVSICYQSR